MSNKILKDFLAFSLQIPNKRIREKIADVCNEDDLNYAADELLLLSEEILSQVSAFGVCLYLQLGGVKQKEWNNDYILQDLFLNKGHQNAGPIFYKVRDIVNEIRTEIPENVFKLFDSESDINKELQELAAFRNALMHGFFVLPAEKNAEKIELIKQLLEKLKTAGIFEYKADFHFWDNDGFVGHWHINEDKSEWINLTGKESSLFQKLAEKAYNELFDLNFINNIESKSIPNLIETNFDEINDFIKSPSQQSDFKESLFVSFHPEDEKEQLEFFENTYSLLNSKENTKVISYTIDEEGISYTSYLLYRLICNHLKINTLKDDKIKDKIKTKLTELRKNTKNNSDEFKLIILINNIHLVPFATNHITSLMKFFNECQIHFIGIGHQYEHLNSLFSQKIDLRKDKNSIPYKDKIIQLIHNHTRHHGPYETESEFVTLNEIIKTICDRIKENKLVKARELADKLINVETELINEAFYILYPYLKYETKSEESNFEVDKTHELYGFPESQTESTTIFLTLGRRDVKLEYKHKILR